MEKMINKLEMTNKAFQKELAELRGRIDNLEKLINKYHAVYGPIRVNNSYLCKGNPDNMVKND